MFNFKSSSVVVPSAVKTAETIKQSTTESVQDGVPVFRILVDGNVVYEGKSGSVNVQPIPQPYRSQTITNSNIIGGSIMPGIAVKIEGDVHGNVDAPMDITCHNVTGNVRSGMNVSCRDVSGDVRAGMSINCVKVGGKANAGMNVNISNR